MLERIRFIQCFEGFRGELNQAWILHLRMGVNLFSLFLCECDTIKLMILLFWCTEQESIFGEAHIDQTWNCVEVLDFNARNIFSSILQNELNFKNISQLRANQKEKPLFLMICCVSCELCFSVRPIRSDREPYHFVILFSFVKQKVFKNNKDASWTIRKSWNRNEHMCCLINRDILFADHIVHSKIHFVID